MKTGEGLLHTESDSLPVIDSIPVTGQNGIFRSGTTATDTMSSRFPFSNDIRRELTPDWILYILIAILIVLAWIRVAYSKYLGHLFESAINYLRSVQVYEDPGVIQKRILLIFNFVFAITGGLYLYLLMDHYALYPLGLKGLALFTVSAGFLAGYMIFRVILLKLTGLIFNRYELFNKYIFQSFLFNKITGIVIIPFILAISYSKGLPKEIFIYLSIFAVTAVLILRLIRLLIFIFKNVVLLFYLILYLCTLEILPILVIVKLILSLASVKQTI